MPSSFTQGSILECIHTEEILNLLFGFVRRISLCKACFPSAMLCPDGLTTQSVETVVTNFEGPNSTLAWPFSAKGQGFFQIWKRITFWLFLRVSCLCECSLYWDKNFFICPLLFTIICNFSITCDQFFFKFSFSSLKYIWSVFFSFIFISWRLVTLQYCSGFCHTLTWISHGFTCVP